MTINTVNIKSQQLQKGFFTVDSGPQVVLVMGSCRVAPYMQYLHDWNTAHGNQMTIHSLDPFNFNWSVNDDRVDYLGALKEQESNQELLTMLKSVDIFIHEHYANAAMFNCDKNATDGIYSFGMKAPVDICIPSFNDLFILAGDILSFDLPMRKKSIQDINVLGKLSDETKKEIANISNAAIVKFHTVCNMSDVKEMAAVFAANFKQKRFWHSYNHVTKEFTLAIFKLINEKYLHLDLSTGFNENHVDIFANSYTKLTDLDIEMFGYQWNEEVISIKEKLF